MRKIAHVAPSSATARETAFRLWGKIVPAQVAGVIGVPFDRDPVMDEYESETLFRMQNAVTKNSTREK